MKKYVNYFVVGLLSIIIFLGIRQCAKPRSKYAVYAANSIYYCNHFVISGKTIYFDDVDGKRVFINGDYTLLYEKDKEE